jgi:pilus assembly protein Flp/PilA
VALAHVKNEPMNMSSRRGAGQGLAEYALILALIAIVVIIALQFLGQSINTLLSTVGSSV